MSRRKRHFISWSAAVLMMSAVFYNWARIWLCFQPSGTEYEVVRLDLTQHYQEKSADQFFAAAEKIIRKPVDEWIFPENRKIQFLDRIAWAPGSTRGMEFGSLTNSWKPRFDNPVEWVTYHRIEPWRKALYINAARKLARDPEFSVDAFHRLREAEERGFFSRRELDRLSIEIASTAQEVELLNEREYDSYRQWGTYRDDWPGPLEYLARRAYEENRREWIDDLVLAKREPDRASQKLKMLGELYFCDEADFLENFLKSNGAWLKKIETWEHRGCPVELEDVLLQRFAGAEGKSEKEVCYRALSALAAAYVRTDQRDRIESLLVRTSEAAFGVERAKQPYFVWLFDEHDQYPDIRRIPETGFHHDPAEFSKSILLNHQAVKEFDYLPYESSTFEAIGKSVTSPEELEYVDRIEDFLDGSTFSYSKFDPVFNRGIYCGRYCPRWCGPMGRTVASWIYGAAHRASGLHRREFEQWVAKMKAEKPHLLGPKILGTAFFESPEIELEALILNELPEIKTWSCKERFDLAFFLTDVMPRFNRDFEIEFLDYRLVEWLERELGVISFAKYQNSKAVNSTAVRKLDIPLAEVLHQILLRPEDVENSVESNSYSQWRVSDTQDFPFDDLLVGSLLSDLPPDSALGLILACSSWREKEVPRGYPNINDRLLKKLLAVDSLAEIHIDHLKEFLFNINEEAFEFGAAIVLLNEVFSHCDTATITEVNKWIRSSGRAKLNPSVAEEIGIATTIFISGADREIPEKIAGFYQKLIESPELFPAYKMTAIGTLLQQRDRISLPDEFIEWLVSATIQLEIDHEHEANFRPEVTIELASLVREKVEGNPDSFKPIANEFIQSYIGNTALFQTAHGPAGLRVGRVAHNRQHFVDLFQIAKLSDSQSKFGAMFKHSKNLHEGIMEIKECRDLIEAGDFKIAKPILYRKPWQLTRGLTGEYTATFHEQLTEFYETNTLRELVVEAIFAGLPDAPDLSPTTPNREQRVEAVEQQYSKQSQWLTPYQRYSILIHLAPFSKMMAEELRVTPEPKLGE